MLRWRCSLRQFNKNSCICGVMVTQQSPKLRAIGSSPIRCAMQS